MISRYINAAIGEWLADESVPLETIEPELENLNAWVRESLRVVKGTVLSRPLVEKLNDTIFGPGNWKIREEGGIWEGRRYITEATCLTWGDVIDLERKWADSLVHLTTIEPQAVTIAFVLSLNSVECDSSER